jgi:hypothetical protein
MDDTIAPFRANKQVGHLPDHLGLDWIEIWHGLNAIPFCGIDGLVGRF